MQTRITEAASILKVEEERDSDRQRTMRDNVYKTKKKNNNNQQIVFEEHQKNRIRVQSDVEKRNEENYDITLPLWLAVSFIRVFDDFAIGTKHTQHLRTLLIYF